MPSPQVSRRTVARGAAWSVPLVAVGVAAPAFAASSGDQPTPSGSNESCKCPPTSSYLLSVTFATPGSDTWQITMTKIYFGTFDEPFTPPANTTLAGGDGILRYAILNIDNNNNSTYPVLISFTATNLTTPEVLTFTNVSLGSINFSPCAKPAGLCP